MALPKLTAPTHTLILPVAKTKVKYRPFLVSEEKLLLMAMESKNEAEMKDAVIQIIKNCTFDKLDPENMAIVDIEYMFLYLRIKSKGSNADYSFKCSECGVTNEKQADLTKVDIINKDRSDVITLTSDIGLKMKAPSFSLSNTISDDMDSADVFNVIVNSIESIYEGDEVHLAKDQNEDELMEFIESLNSNQFKDIREYFENIPSLELEIDFGCVSCKTDNKVTLRGLSDFLA